jgi:hypothetical protein
VRIRVSSTKSDTVTDKTDFFRILPPSTSNLLVAGQPKRGVISVTQPVFTTRWDTINGSVPVAWSSVGVPDGANCSVALFLSRFWSPAGDRLVSVLTPPGGVACADNAFVATVPEKVEFGWPAYVVVATLDNQTGVWNSGSAWGRSELFVLQSTKPPDILQFLQTACANFGEGGWGAPAALCAASCTNCPGYAVWIPGATISLDFEVDAWAFAPQDLTILKVALGAVRSAGVNVCWPKAAPSADPTARGTVRTIFVGNGAVAAWPQVSALLPPGVAVRPFLRLEYGSSGPFNDAACVKAQGMLAVPFTAVTGGLVTAGRAAGMAARVQSGLSSLLGVPASLVFVSVDKVVTVDASAGASGVAIPGAVSGTIPAVALLDPTSGSKVAAPGTGSPALMRRRRLAGEPRLPAGSERRRRAMLVTGGGRGTRLWRGSFLGSASVGPGTGDAAGGGGGAAMLGDEHAEGAADSWGWAPPESGHRASALAATASAAGLERRRDRVRRLQMYPPPPEGPPMTTLVQMSAHVFLKSASDARLAAQVLLMDATAGAGASGAGDALPSNGPVFNMADGAVDGAPALVIGAYKGYNGGGATGEVL